MYRCTFMLPGVIECSTPKKKSRVSSLDTAMLEVNEKPWGRARHARMLRIRPC